ncbi:MAG: M24 family metallopeptidase [bacterium]
MSYIERINRLREEISRNYDGFLIMNPVNLRYLLGFRGDASVLLLTGNKTQFFVNEMYYEQAKKDCKDIEITPTERDWIEVIAKSVNRGKIKRLAFESDISFSTYKKLATFLNGIDLVPAEDIITSLRIKKDDEEIACIKKAAEIADLAFMHLKTVIKPGIREQDLVAEFEYFIRKKGSRTSFEPIILFGDNSSLPHGVSSSREIKSKGILLIDYGAMYNGYCSDATRTVHLGKPAKEDIRLYNIVLKAQEEAESVIKPGISAREIDKTARDVIAKEGFGNRFIHTTGHGVGLEIHEPPRISIDDNTIIEKGMVITIEPGIYLEGYGGIRIEDLVLVTEKGVEVLTKIGKDFEFRGGTL